MMVAALTLAGSASAQLRCFYADAPQGVQDQVCYDLSRPAEATRAKSYEQSLTPRPGVFDGPAPVREMFTARHLRTPSGAQAMMISEVSGLEFQGAVGGAGARMMLAGVRIIPGQEAAVAAMMRYWVPASSVLYAELTGEYARSGVPVAYLWLGSSLLSVMLVERGVAEPTGVAGPYRDELILARAFAQAQKLGAFAVIAPPRAP